MSGGVAGKAVRDGNPEESFASRAVTPNPVEYPERLGNFDAPARYAHVLIDRRSRRVEQALTYAVPAELVPGIQIGSRVVVPLGRSTAPGYVIGLPAEADVPDVRPIRALIGGGPVFDAELLGVVRWVADRYLCSLPDALRGAMPAETLARPTRVVRPVVEGEALRAALLDLEKAGRPAVLAVMRALARLGRQPLPALRRVMEREAARAGSGAGVRAGGR
ncbi:MAG: hypothetical protein HY660_02190, partial [Armatimonadetes bacterium]|nr:hypothetical protein [Armatimonadota bacterium]